MYFQKKFLDKFKLGDGGCVFLQNLLIQVVFVVSALFFRFDQASFNQYFQVVTHGRLRQVAFFLDVGTGTTSSFFGDVLQNLQPVGIAQCFRYFFDLFSG